MKHLNYEELGRLIFENDTAVFAEGHLSQDIYPMLFAPYSGSLLLDSRERDTCFMKIRLVSKKDTDGILAFAKSHPKGLAVRVLLQIGIS